MAIFLEPVEPLLYKIYKNDFSLESLAKISKIFKFFDTIEEAINSLNECFDSDNYSFNIENKKIIIEIEANLFHKKNVIHLELFEEEKKIEQNDVINEIKK